MANEIQVGDLVKLRGMKKGEFPIGIVKRIFPHNWDGEKAFADIKWSNPQIAVRWAINSPIAVKSLEKIE